MNGFPLAAFALLLAMAYLVARPLLQPSGDGAPAGAAGRDDTGPGSSGPVPPAAAGTDDVERLIAARKQELTQPVCGGCGRARDADDRFCRHCGAAVTGASGEVTP